MLIILVSALELLQGCTDYIGSLQKDISLYVKFDICNHPQNFGRVIALFRLSFCCCIGFCSITFARISLEVCRRIYHCKIQVKFNIGIHPQKFGHVMALFRLSFCCWGKIQGKDITFEGMH